MHLGKGMIERDIEQAFPDKDAALVLYCGGGFRSALAADNLQKMGYTNVISMDGGWRAWTEAGYPTEKPGEDSAEELPWKKAKPPANSLQQTALWQSSVRAAQNLSLLDARHLQEVFMACYNVRSLGRGPTGRTPHC